MNSAAQSVRIEDSWKVVLQNEFEQPYWEVLKQFLRAEKAAGYTLYPPGKLIFNAFDSTPFDRVKAVILGQDPYHGPGQAHGLSFSVRPGFPPPPSLQNIYKELHEDVGFEIPRHGYLQSWADQGVMLLNSILTVRARDAASHRGKGWEQFTDAAIRALSEKRTGISFLLWGKFAQQKAALIDSNRHQILTAAHPSPFAAHRGFFGCRHFSKTNAYLKANDREPIDWRLPLQL